MISTEAVLGLPGYQITGIEERAGLVWIAARYGGAVVCPHCHGTHLRRKDRKIRKLRHESWGTRLWIPLESERDSGMNANGVPG